MKLYALKALKASTSPKTKIVSSNVTKSGKTISGNIKEIVIVKTDTGYQLSPGYPGTGTVVGVVCQQ